MEEEREEGGEVELRLNDSKSPTCFGWIPRPPDSRSNGSWQLAAGSWRTTAVWACDVLVAARHEMKRWNRLGGGGPVWDCGEEKGRGKGLPPPASTIITGTRLEFARFFTLTPLPNWAPTSTLLFDLTHLHPNLADLRALSGTASQERIFLAERQRLLGW